MSQARNRVEVSGQFTIVGEDCEIGEGTRIWNMVYIGHRVKIGANVTISSLVHISDGSVVGDGTQIEGSAYLGRFSKVGKNCFVGPNSTLTGDPFPPVRRVTGVAAWASAVLEDGVVIGATAVVRSGVTIGRRSVVGMGAVVLQDVPPESVVVGSPARFVYPRSEYDRKQLEWVKATGDRLSTFTGLPGVTELPR